MKFLFAFTLARETFGLAATNDAPYVAPVGTPCFAIAHEDDYVEFMAVLPTGALVYVSDVPYEHVRDETAWLMGAPA